MRNFTTHRHSIMYNGRKAFQGEKMNFYYRIYGQVFSSNVKLPMAELHETELTDPVHKLNISFAQLEKRNFDIVIKCISESGMRYYVGLGEYADYFIYGREHKIDIVAVNFESFFSTFFNIPLSVYMLLEDRPILHCSGLQRNEDLYLFIGEKGVGKSTLVSFLEKMGFGNVYNDDTLCINRDTQVYPAIPFVKLTDTSSALLNYNVDGLKRNVAGKYYFPIKTVGLKQPLFIKSIFFIYPSDCGKKPVLTSIDNEKIVKSRLTASVVGVHYMSRQLIRQTMQSSCLMNLVKDTAFFSLFHPHDSVNCETNIHEIAHMIFNDDIVT